MTPQPDQLSTSQSAQLLYPLVSELGLKKARHDVTMSKSTSEIYPCLKRNTEKVMTNTAIAFDGMCKALELERDEVPEADRCAEIRRALKTIADSMFVDSCTNWGRVVTLIAFGCHLAKHCVENKGQEEAEEVAREISYFLADYLDNEFSEKLRSLGGWAALTTTLQEKPDVESLMWKGLVGTFFGLGVVSLALIAAK